MPPIRLGRTVRAIRDRLGLSREAMADRLDVSHATMEEIEANAVPTPDAVVDRFRVAYGIDLVVAGWSLFGDVTKLPQAVREPAVALTAHWDRELAGQLDAATEKEAGS